MSLPLLERVAPIGASQTLPGIGRTQTRYSWAWVAILISADLVVFCGALLAAAVLGYGHHRLGFPMSRLILYNVVYVLLWLAVFERLGLYRKSVALTVKDELYFTVAALTIGVIPQLLLFTAVPAISSSRVVLLYALLFSIVGAGVTRTSLHAIRTRNAPRQSRKVAVIGSSERVEQVRSAMDLPRACTLLVPVNDIDADCVRLRRDVGAVDLPWLSGAFAWGCDSIVFADVPPPGIIPHLLEAAAERGVRIAFAPPRIRRQSYALTLEIDGSQALIVPERLKACTPRARLLKRMMDVVCASIALAIFAPVMVVCAICIRLESGAPIFFRQQRIGQNGRVFEILKFRSMRIDAESQTGAVWAKEGDDRCTRFGSLMRRFSLDETPQLFNVLKGDMSLLGPRPERPIFVAAFRQKYPRYDERHLVRPGLSGLSQMQMRRVLTPTDVAQKLKYDLYYLEEWSLFLDISLLIRTATEFLFQRAA